MTLSLFLMLNAMFVQNAEKREFGIASFILWFAAVIAWVMKQ